ncbi:MAG: YdcH family protein [Ketobacter sp.]
MDLNTEQAESILERIHELRQEHRDLDDAIDRLGEGPFIDEVQLRRMKRKKLLLKDKIVELEALLLPDQPA